MNKYEPKAEKRRCVQHNQTAYESSQPGASSLDDFQPGFGDQSMLGFFAARKEMDPVGEGGWEPLGREIRQDHGARCSRGPQPREGWFINGDPGFIQL